MTSLSPGSGWVSSMRHDIHPVEWTSNTLDSCWLAPAYACHLLYLHRDCVILVIVVILRCHSWGGVHCFPPLPSGITCSDTVGNGPGKENFR